MKKIFLIADTHFGEESMRKYENRPFRDAAHMDAELIARWNEAVSADDKVYVLGDFGADGYEAKVLEELNGRKYLVKGNHDVKSNQVYRDFGFEEVYDCPIIIDEYWILSHEPLYVNTNMPYANLFGHVHNSPLIKDFSNQHYCVSAERINYTPIDFEVVKQSVKKAVESE